MADDDPDHPEDADIEPSLFPAEQPTVDAANIRVHRKQVTRQKLETKQAEKFWQSIFSTAVGRREMWKLLMSSHTFEERFACGPNGFPNSDATWFNRGEQSFGQRLYHTWVSQPALRADLLLMHDENDNRFKRPRAPDGGA